MPPVGAGSSQREDSPAHRHHHRTHAKNPNKNDAELLGQALEGGRATLEPPLQHLPCQECDSRSRHLIEL